MLEWVVISFSGDLPNPGTEPTSGVSCIGRKILYQLSHCTEQFRNSDDNIMCFAVQCLVTQSCPTLWPMSYSPPGFSVHRDSLGKNTGVGCHALLLGIFPTQGLNPGLPYCRRILYHLSHQQSPGNTEVGSLSLLHGIAPKQESNQGLLISLGYMVRNGIAGLYGGKISPLSWATGESWALLNYQSLVSSQFSYLGMIPHHSHLMLPSELFLLFGKEKKK